MEWTHDNLAEDLAGHVKGPRRMVWLNMQLGPSGSPRPDVYSIDTCYSRPNPTAYECKISREDFRADITSGKWQSYLEYAHRVIFAAPAGLLTKADVPHMCGLILRHEQAWRLAKAATVNPRPIAQEALLKCLIDGVEREGPHQRAKRYREFDHQREFDRKFGSTAARYVADAASVQQELVYAEERRQKLLERAEQDAASLRKRAMESMPLEWKALLSVLDLPEGSDEWAVRRAIADVKRAKTGDEYGVALRQVIQSLRRLVQMNEHLTEEKKSAETVQTEEDEHGQ